MDREARLERELATLLARHAKLANQGGRNTAEDLLDRISKIQGELRSDSDGIEKAQKAITEFDREIAEIKKRIV
jgi:peptidoglycan hydrolase CwlO-like protein